MNEKIQRRSELLIENRNLMHNAFRLENGLVTVVSGSAFMEKDKNADPELVKECRDLLRQRKGVFSDMRGNNELLISTKMAVSGSPERYLDDIIEVYDNLQQGKFFGSSFRVLAASIICDAGKANEAGAIIEKTNEILKGMKAAHPFLTSDEDTGFAVLLAMTDKSVETILAELEESYRTLKADFSFHDNAVYSLAQVLTAYEGDSKEKSKKALEFFEAFKDAGHKYGKDYELPSLGVLVNLGDNIGEIVADVIEVAESFKGAKGFGVLDMSKQTKLMLGAMIVSGVYGEENHVVNASVEGSALAMLIAQEAAMVAIMCAASASAVSSSSN
jgi:hypothetical protein